jgi:mannan endo-1,4-beta-mannosidase
MWVHVDGQYTPEINSSGHVTATDSTDTLIPEMLKYLQTAQEMNLMVVFVLWNGADFNNPKAL